MAANMDLIARTLGQIIVNPEEWTQATWRCGSGMCFAGHAAALSGHQFAAPANSLYAEYVFDDEGEALWDEVEKIVVEDAMKTVKSLIQGVNRTIEEGNNPGRWALAELASATEAARTQLLFPDRFKRVSAVDKVAARELGISRGTANYLFAGDNDLSTLINFASIIAKGEEL
jgi:hypothetical protein